MMIALCGCLKTTEDITHLSVKSIDISAEKIKTATVDLNTYLYIINSGEQSSKNTSALLKIYDMDTSLLEQIFRIDIGAIGPGKTKIITQKIMLPRKGSHELNVNLYEDEILKSISSKNIYNLENLQPESKDIGIEIGEMDFLVRNITGHKVQIETDVYFSNEGSNTSATYDVLVKAREKDAGLIADKKWMKLKPIKSESTVIQSINLTVPDSYNYIVEASIWSNDTLVKRGEGTVQLKPTMIVSKDQTIQSRNIDLNSFRAESAVEEVPEMPYEYESESTEGSKGMPGFDIFSALIASLIILIRRRLKYA